MNVADLTLSMCAGSKVVPAAGIMLLGDFMACKEKHTTPGRGLSEALSQNRKMELSKLRKKLNVCWFSAGTSLGALCWGMS